MKKLLTLVSLCLFFYISSFSQYANSGTGALKNDIWWFDWAGMNLSANPSKTVTTPDGLTITYTYYGSSPYYPYTSVMNTWPGAVLHFLYDFTNPAIQPALYQLGSAGTNLQFNLNVKVTRNGLPVPFTLVAADAEASTTDEITTFMTNTGVWQMVDFFRNSSQTTNPVSGCNTNTVMLSDTYGNAAATGQNPVMASSTTTGDITIWTKLDHHVDGGMGVAFGIMAPIDRGDLPASYGYAYHGLPYTVNNGCNYLPPLPSATKSQTLKLGAVSGDADGVQTLDDNANGADEDGISLFPVYYNTGVYSVLAKFNNTTGSDAYLTGWFDYNRNGVFDNGESTTVTVPDNATSATLTWVGLPTWLPQGAVTDYGVRLRLSSDKAATQNTTGFAKDGEVEDYIIPAATLCNISIQTINDRNVCLAQPVTLTTTGTNITSYNWDVPTFLTDATIASPVATPTSDITYTVTGSNPQGCIAKDMVTLAVKLPPVITINNDTTICPGTAVQLSANAPGAYSYTWLPQSGLDNYAIATPVARPTATTTYVVKVDAGTGCEGKDSIKIALYAFKFEVEPGLYVCKDVPYRLWASGGDEYTWLAPDNSIVGKTDVITVIPQTTQTYRVIIKENTCNTSDTLSSSIHVLTTTVTAVVSKSNDVDCVTNQAVLHASGGDTYQWIGPGISDGSSPNPVVIPTQTTTYVVAIWQGGSCPAMDSIKVIVDRSRLPIAVNKDTTICKGATVQLLASAPGAVAYTWLPSTGLNNNAIASPVAQPVISTTYVVKADNGQGCVGEDSVKIALHAPPDFAVSPANGTICENDQVQLTASGGDNYSWLDASNSPVGNTASITVQPTATQTYQVIIKENTCNNSATRSIPVTVNPLPVPVVSKSNDVDCNTPGAMLHASGGSTYAWDVSPDLSDLTSSDPAATPQQTTTYNVKVTSTAGCSAKGSVTVNADKQKPVVTINNDTTICSGTAVQLTAGATGTGVSYAWLPQTGLNNSSIATPLAQPTVATTYIVSATAANGCIGKDSVKIDFHAPPSFVVNPSKATLCEKESIQLTASGGDNYSWLDAGNSPIGNTASITVQPAASQTYQVIIKENTCNNSDTRSIPVTVNSLPVPSITKSNDIDCSTGQATLRATGGVTYEWDAAPGMGNTLSSNPVVTPVKTTTYFVTITNNNGCSVRDSVTVMADFAKAMSTYPVPSAFTPNNDGRNDCFGLKLWGQVTQLQFQVFNRWGQRVFATTDPSQCWDGTFKGEPLPAGGYAYTIKAVTPCGSVNRTGMVILIR